MEVRGMRGFMYLLVQVVGSPARHGESSSCFRPTARGPCPSTLPKQSPQGSLRRCHLGYRLDLLILYRCCLPTLHSWYILNGAMSFSLPETRLALAKHRPMKHFPKDWDTFCII